MTLPARIDEVDNLVDTGETLFAPANLDPLNDLFEAYDLLRALIGQVAQRYEQDVKPVLRYFAQGNLKQEAPRSGLDEMFAESGAVASLNAAYWQKAMKLTDCFETMPAQRRAEWNEQIQEMKTPEFVPDIVVPTIRDLLNARTRFFAERVEGVFRGLSRSHVTNTPEGFFKRMIISDAFDRFGSPNGRVADLIFDLRYVIARFTGRDINDRSSCWPLMEASRKYRGEWFPVDGGSFRIRAYQVGTVHIELHPDMAARLNGILAFLYPSAIPSRFRQRTRKTATPKDFGPMEVPLPYEIAEAFCVRNQYDNRKFQIKSYGISDGLRREVEKICELLGGVKVAFAEYRFDYDFHTIATEIQFSGRVPSRTHAQFYPTPLEVGAIAARMLDAGAGHRCLEPSCGRGDLAHFLPRERTVCVEISPILAAVARERGYQVIEADFLAWARENAGQRFDRILVNPPFADGRALLHLEAAAALLVPGGVMTAILPVSFATRSLIDGWKHERSELQHNAFAHTGVSVVIVSVTRPKASL